MNAPDLNKKFLAGCYREILAQTGSYALPPTQTDFFELTAMQVGSLMFLGDLREAQILFDATAVRKRPAEFTAQCLFYLGIGYVRHFDFRRASQLFAQNLRWVLREKKSSPLVSFHAWQGAAFFRLSRGQFSRCEPHAQKAYEAAFVANYPYGQILALELLAISHCQLGTVRQGLHEFEKSLALVKEIGNGGIQTALEVSRLRYRSLVGIDLRNGERELTEALRELTPQDTYSTADLVLELCRQQILRGKVSEAQRTLDGACELIYKHQNKRQSALFNFRYSHILFLKGERSGAVTILRTALQTMDPHLDAVTYRQMQGFYKRLQNQPPVFDDELTSLDARIQRRAGAPRPAVAGTGEDPLGDLIDSLTDRGPLRVSELKRLGFLGLIPRALGLSPTDPQIILGPDRGQLLAVKNGDVLSIDSGITAPMRRLLFSLRSKDFRSKEALVRETWAYSYDPVVHDKLLYATIAKLRGHLGPFSGFLEWSSEGYRLATGVNLVDPFSTATDGKRTLKEKSPVARKLQKNRNAQLNIRQIRVLRQFERGEVFDVTSYAKRFRVCKMTACRDLAILAKEGFVLKIGKARATKYVGEKYL